MHFLRQIAVNCSLSASTPATGQVRENTAHVDMNHWSSAFRLGQWHPGIGALSDRSDKPHGRCLVRAKTSSASARGLHRQSMIVGPGKNACSAGLGRQCGIEELEWPEINLAGCIMQNIAAI